ncbi:MAG TPA: molybdopterin-dependent oxidoreductase [Anaerolineaceae bacterium]
MTTVTIDGKQIEVPEGTTVLRAAQMAGISIPTLCDHPELTPYGGCRLCLVEVEGARTMQPSCTLPVSPNMVVHTDTQKVRDARKFVLTLIFSERNHFCMYCQVSGGDCELQNAAYREGMTHWPLQPNWQPFAVDASHPYFVLDNNRCILCRRCVRACSELVGNHTLGFEERGARSFLVADLGVPMGESTCVACGTCLQVCPTGALIDRQSAYRGKETQVETTASVCAGCSVGCAMNVLTRDNHLVRIESNWEGPVNGGLLCEIGRFAQQMEEHERISTPLVRKNGSLKAATWQEALDVIASRVRPLSGANGVAALASTRLPVEALSAFKQIFADGLESDMVTSLEEGASTAAAFKLANEMGRPFEGKLGDLANADLVLVFDADVTKLHEVASFFFKRNLQAGTNLVVVDRNENELDRLGIPVKALRGSQAEMLEALTAAKSGQPLDIHEVKTGVPAGKLALVGELLRDAQNPVIVYGNVDGADLKSLLALAGTAKVLGVKGAANSFAGALLGLEKPFQLNGHQAVFVALGDDEPSQRLVKKLTGAPFLAVQASYASQLTAQADVVLPVQNWAEQDGHYVNLDGHIQAAHKAITVPEDVRSNAAALEDLAACLGITISGNWREQLCQRVSAAALEG